MASPLRLFWKLVKLLICQVTPGSDSGSTSACPSLAVVMGNAVSILACVCKFYMTLAILSPV